MVGAGSWQVHTAGWRGSCSDPVCRFGERGAGRTWKTLADVDLTGDLIWRSPARPVVLTRGLRPGLATLGRGKRAAAGSADDDLPHKVTGQPVSRSARTLPGIPRTSAEDRPAPVSSASSCTASWPAIPACRPSSGIPRPSAGHHREQPTARLSPPAGPPAASPAQPAAYPAPDHGRPARSYQLNDAQLSPGQPQHRPQELSCPTEGCEERGR
jgi:hypothetical protein